MPSDVKRKLAAIMFTDIAGYTALSSTDENKALKLLDKQEQILTLKRDQQVTMVELQV